MRICLVQQHPVDEERIPAAILRWVVLHDRLLARGHEVVSVGPNQRWRLETRIFRGAPQLMVPGPGSGIKALDMAVFALLLGPVLLLARRRWRPEAWFMDELFVGPGLALLRLVHRREAVVYDVMGIHYHQVRKHNRNLWRQLPLAWIYGALERLTLWGATLVSTVNEAHRTELLRWTRRPVAVIRDAAEFPDGAPPALALPAKEEGTIWLSFVGKISNRRLDDLYHILPDLMAAEARLRLIIVGNGPFHRRYTEWTARLGLQDRVHFADFVPHAQLPAWLAPADITYSDDWSDIGFPMKVFEYMALGKAILVEDTPAVREVMRHEENGLLYEGQEGLRDGILRLCRDGGLRRRIGAAAAAEARARHRWDDRIDRFERLFAQARLGALESLGRSESPKAGDDL
ncbi:MAG: glycosyltransferase family 4 protein [bacterium]|jgi:glycosyltransferase involved in cell wall biosynthesis|nr:glycosyltransferase family 4 protein [bacterium]